MSMGRELNWRRTGFAVGRVGGVMVGSGGLSGGVGSVGGASAIGVGSLSGVVGGVLLIAVVGRNFSSRRLGECRCALPDADDS